MCDEITRDVIECVDFDEFMKASVSAPKAKIGKRPELEV